MNGTTTIDGTLLGKMLRAGCHNLRTHAQEINELNVFPIPDGDTGDNMLLTMLGGIDTLGDGCEGIAEVSRRVSDGMLLGARGNSGVILSQIFEGVADGLTGLEEADNEAFIKALKNGVKHSYSAVIEPTEGTILTVMRSATEYVSTKVTNDPFTMLEDFLKQARLTLEQTPEMLPVLKKAGVVDSGGAGLVYIIEGMLKAKDGEEAAVWDRELTGSEQKLDLDLFSEDSVLEYGYCTELLLRLQRCKTDIESFEVSTLTDYFKEIGDSVVAFKTGSIVKIHIHTTTPDRVLAHCQKFGEFLKIKIENMSLQHNNTTTTGIKVSVKPKSERKRFGVVAVASGEGIKDLFLDRGADVVLDGGKSMNPSAEDLMNAFDSVNADTVFVLPNNSNVILAARQAAGMYKSSDVRVIESRTPGDGYAALAMLSFESANADEIENEMNEATRGVVTAEVSKSVRDTEQVRAGEYIGFVGKDIIAAEGERYDCAVKTADRLVKDCDVVILIYGQDTECEEAQSLMEYITSHYRGKEVYLVDGKQEIYDYIMIFE